MWFRTLTVAAVLVVLAACADREPSAPVGLEDGTGLIQAGKGDKGGKGKVGSGYTIIDLHPSKRGSSSAKDISSSGQVVGRANGPSLTGGFIWTSSNGWLDLEDGGAEAINDYGTIVGYGAQPLVWRLDAYGTPGSPQNLLTLGGAGGWAFDINNVNVAVGSTQPAGSDRYVATVWLDQSTPCSLKTLGNESSRAWAVNDQGRVVGYRTGAEVWPAQAVLWTLAATCGDQPQVLELEPPGYASSATDITEETADGIVWIAGYRCPSDECTASVWKVDVNQSAFEVMESLDLGPFYAEGINADGTMVVGYDWTRSFRAILWKVQWKLQGGTLQETVELGSLKGASWAYAINENEDGSTIVGSNGSAAQRAVVWIKQQ